MKRPRKPFGDLSSDTTASGLIAAANDYEDADSRSDGLFGILQRFVS